MLVVSGIAYYFKIYKPKHNRKDTDYEEEFEFIDDAEIEKEINSAGDENITNDDIENNFEDDAEIEKEVDYIDDDFENDSKNEFEYNDDY